MYYKVYVKCGHVGINNCINVWMPVIAETKKEAAAKARWIPRVKHHHKDAILDVVRIDEEEYYELIKKNKCDPFLNCHSKQEQNCIDNLYVRIEEDTYNTSKIKKYEKIYMIYKNRLVRNVKKYAKFNHYFDNTKEEFDYAY